MQSAGRHVDGLAERLRAIGVQRMALAGGLSSSLEPWLSQETSVGWFQRPPMHSPAPCGSLERKPSARRSPIDTQGCLPWPSSAR